MPEIIIPSKDGGSFSAYVAMPEVLPAPTVILIQEIFGVNAEMRAKCDALAGQGFIAVCPDLFWRMEPGVQLTDKSEAEWAKAFDFFNRFDVDLGIDDLRATYHTFRGHAQSTGKVGCVGYCLGGKLAYLMAARTHIDASVSYYGVGLDQLLDEAQSIKKPLLMHIAEGDKFVPPDAQAKIKAGLARNPHVTIHSYANVDHAFARGGGEHYDAAAAEKADARTLAFLQDVLKA
ncbi:MAG: dienelactone hydrolase family protein [Micavibrio sp.]